MTDNVVPSIEQALQEVESAVLEVLQAKDEREQLRLARTISSLTDPTTEAL